jgi:hypothetical protein
MRLIQASLREIISWAEFIQNAPNPTCQNLPEDSLQQQRKFPLIISNPIPILHSVATHPSLLPIDFRSVVDYRSLFPSPGRTEAQSFPAIKNISAIRQMVKKKVTAKVRR